MKVILYVMIGFNALFLSSCKNFLDTVPTDFLSPANYYETQEHLEYARQSVYMQLAANNTWGNTIVMYLFLNADEAYFCRELNAGVVAYNYSVSDLQVGNFWTGMWDGINRANTLLDNVDKNEAIPLEYRDRVRGETLFLRGFYYFTLTQYFGALPLRLNMSESVNDTDKPRATLAETYQQIIDDMTAAEALVPSIKTVGHGAHINKSAVRGLLARVNLHMAGYPLRDESKYAEAKRWAKMVIDDTEAGHQLNPNYADIFIKLAADRYDTNESIWEIEFWGNHTAIPQRGTIHGNWNGNVSFNPNTGRGDRYVHITPQLYRSYDQHDNRLYWNVAHFNYTPTGPNGAKTLFDKASYFPETTTGYTNMYERTPGKFRREFEEYLPKSARTPQNIPLLRYSDILMMYAEAENAINGPTADPNVRNYLNQVRRRGYSKGVKSPVSIPPGPNRGSGYTAATTTVEFSEGLNGTRATGRAIISGGTVTGVVLDRDPTGIMYYQEGIYDTPPTITITSTGGGTGAQAVATIYTPSDADVPQEWFASKEKMLEFIQQERKREFAYEYMRKADLVRWGIFLETHQAVGSWIRDNVNPASNFYLRYQSYLNARERDVLLPIPAQELIGNKAIIQNPGWQ